MLKSLFARLARDEKGASLVEYAVALLVVAAVGVATFSVMGRAVDTNSDTACRVLTGGTGSNGAGSC